jgi:hypothetical protein
MEHKGAAESNRGYAREDAMFMKILKSTIGKAALAAVLLGAFSFAGAPNAQAAERVIVRYGYPAPVVRRVYVAPAPYVRVAPRIVVRGWYDRFGCWHRY